MRMTHGLATTALLILGAATAQTANPALVLTGPQLAEALDVGQATHQVLDLPMSIDGATTVDVVLGSQAAVLELWPHSVRSDHFQVLVQVEDGSYVESAAPAPATFRGRIIGQAGSKVAGSLVDGRMTALILPEPGASIWGIQHAADVLPGAGPADHVVYNSQNALPRDHTCGTPSLHDEHDHGDSGSSYAGSNNMVCELACDADVNFYQLNGSSVNNTELDIENVVNAVEAIYEADTGIIYLITTIIVRTSEPDPYTTNNSSSLLGEFQNHWNSNQGGIQRDVAHLFTGKNLSGSVIGVAYLNTICNLGSAYGLSQSKFTGNFTNRVGLTAHELGHNWSAGHCNGSSGCKIMCSSIGGCGAVTSFGPNSINAITNKKNSSACLHPETPPDPPVISNVNPSSGGTIESTTVTLTGQNFEFLGDLVVGSTTITPGQYWQPAGNQIAFVAPTADVGPADITVANLGGTSAPATYTYTGNVPAVMQAGAFGFTGQPFSWQYGGEVGDTAFMIIALTPTTVQISGFTILADLVILQTSVLGNSASDTLEVNPMPAAALGLTIRAQAIMVVGSNIDDASNIVSSFIIV